MTRNHFAQASRLGVAAALLLGGLRSFALEIEYVESRDPLPAARVAFDYAPGQAGVGMNVSPPAGIAEPFAPVVSARLADGSAVEVTRGEDGSFLLRAPDQTALRVSVAPDTANASVAGTLDVPVCCGDLRVAFEGLDERARALPPVIAKESIARALERDMRAWMTHRLQEILADSEVDAETPVSGNVVNEFLFMGKFLGWMEEGGDLVALARGQQIPVRHSFEVRDESGARTMAFNLIVRFPAEASSEPAPLLVVIHGFTPKPSTTGAIREEIESVAARHAFAFLEISLVFNGPMRGSGGWNPTEVTSLIESMQADYAVDRDRTYLTGFSMGGMGTIRVAAHRPDLFAAYAPLCPRADPALAPQLARLPAYFYHGENDPTISFEQSVEFCKALEAAGGSPELRIYRNMGHLVWTDVYRDPRFYERLLAHRRSGVAGE